MLKEDVLVGQTEATEIVKKELKKLGYQILSSSDVGKTGEDIIAKKLDKEVIVEIRGGKKDSDDGKAFNRSQSHTHTSEALYRILKFKEERKDANLILALPYSRHHYEILTAVSSSLRDLKINIFWYNEKGVVRITDYNLV